MGNPHPYSIAVENIDCLEAIAKKYLGMPAPTAHSVRHGNLTTRWHFYDALYRVPVRIFIRTFLSRFFRISAGGRKSYWSHDHPMRFFKAKKTACFNGMRPDFW